MSSPLQEFQELLGYYFDDEETLRQALTHSSLSQIKDGTVYRSFDRLEFLGDRVLNLLVAELLYKEFQKESEGDLAHRYAGLVCFETCSLVAVEINLPQFLMVAPKTNLDDQRILCDALESILGAMFLDGGISPCRRFVRKHWKNRVKESVKPPEDPKSELQEWVQSKWKILPFYRVIEKSGTEHSPLFQVSVQVEGIGTAIGSGSSKKNAEKEAAQKLLTKLKAKC